MKVNKKFLAIGLLVMFLGSITTMLPLVRAAPTVNYIDVWSYPDNNWVPQGGAVNSGRTARIYAGISNPETTVSISYGPSGGSLTTETASYESTWDYYYFDWVIPNGATAGPYDVKVDTGTTSETSTGRFQVENVVVVNYIDVWSYPDNNWVPQGGAVNVGRTARIYAGISNPVEPVSITYTPQGGSPTTVTATHETTWDYYYIDWLIPSDATVRFYDVQVDTGGVSTPSVGRFQVENVVVVNYIEAWSYTVIGAHHPDDSWISQGETVTIGHVVRLYSYISNPAVSVDISYGPTGGSLTTATASHESTWDYYYIDWVIPDSATTGLYDVKVDTGGTSETSVGRFNVAAGLLVDSRFDVSADSAALRLAPPPQKWYESRGAFPTGADPTLLTLETADIGYNVGKKAALKNYGGAATNAYLTQKMASQQIGSTSYTFDIYIDRIQDNAAYDRTGHVFIGTDQVTTNAPTGTAAERFVLIAFYDPTPDTTGSDIQIRARNINSATQDWAITDEWIRVGSNTFSYDTWYTVKIVVNIGSSNYDVYVDGVLQGTVAKMDVFVQTYVQYVSFTADSDGRGDYYIDNVFASTS